MIVKVNKRGENSRLSELYTGSDALRMSSLRAEPGHVGGLARQVALAMRISE